MKDVATMPLAPVDFGQVYKQFYPKVYRLCLRYSGDTDDAFDLAQDVMIKAMESLSGFKGHSTLSTWLYAIARNHCLNQLAGKNRVARLDVAGYVPQEEEETDADEMELRSRREDREEWTIRSLAQLPEQDRLMLEMKYFQKCSIQEIQETFHLSPSAVKMRLHRARQRMERWSDLKN